MVPEIPETIKLSFPGVHIRSPKKLIVRRGHFIVSGRPANVNARQRAAATWSRMEKQTILIIGGLCFLVLLLQYLQAMHVLLATRRQKRSRQRTVWAAVWQPGTRSVGGSGPIPVLTALPGSSLTP